MNRGLKHGTAQEASSELPQSCVPCSLALIRTRPQLYHSLHIDQRAQRAVHVLPEKYQFCSSGVPNSSSNFGTCTARVHYGLCTDFDAFVVGQINENLVSERPSASSQQQQQQQQQQPCYFYPVRRVGPFLESMLSNSRSSSCESIVSTTNTDKSIASRIESYRDDIGATLEFLAEDEGEPNELHNLIRNFVREDRLRQEAAPNREEDEPDEFEQQLLALVTSSTDFDLKSRRIVLKTSQADVLQRLQKQKAAKEASLAVSNSPSETPFLSTNREGVVQSRRIRFTRPSSPPPPPPSQLSNGSVVCDLKNMTLTTKQHHQPETSSHNEPKLVFGISPKSSSLSRYKNLIEARSSETPAAVGLSNQSRQQSNESGTHSRNDSREYLSSSSSSSSFSSPALSSSSLEITLPASELDSSHLVRKSVATSQQQEQSHGNNARVNDTEAAAAATQTAAVFSSSNSSESFPPSRFSSSSNPSAGVVSTTSTVTRVTRPHTNHPQPTNTERLETSKSTLVNSISNSIDAFIKQNENFFQSGNKLAATATVQEDQHQLATTTSTEVEDMKIQQTHKGSALTDDEKALLHETLKVGLYGMAGDNFKQNLYNGQDGEEVDENAKTDKLVDNKPQRRIILVSKPAPKPDPKAEPKYVNGKVVFGQLPVKHVLQKGSVAERVMLFEKCPEKTSVTKSKLNELQRNRIVNPNKIGNWIKTAEKSQIQAETDTKVVKLSTDRDTSLAQATKGAPAKEAGEPPKSPTTAGPTLLGLRRFSRSNSLTGGTPPGQLPRFYYPNGRPYSSHEVESQIKKIIAIFERFPSRTVSRKEFGGVLKLVGLPVYWKEPLFQAVLVNQTKSSSRRGSLVQSLSRSNSMDASNGCLPSVKKEFISCEQFVDYWKKLITSCFDEASRFVNILTQGRRQFLLPEDFESLLQDVIDTHPGLLFLKEAEEFHSRYIHTVIARIFYCLDKTWSGKISLVELRKSNFLRILRLLEEEEDINQITDYFSYEHFYVIYCKFWELDTDHDLFISKYDLSRHNDSALSTRIIDQIFSGAVTRVPRNTDNKNMMSYAEFVWFLLAEEDKRHSRAIEYWFRCMDLDGDGCLSMFELEYFYSEQVKRMEAAGIEALPFTDCLCQMIDLVSPVDPMRITLNDLKRCKLTPIFFDTFFNLEKYLDHEQRDPFASQRNDEDGTVVSDWDRYAAEEYELLVAEENALNSNLVYYRESCPRSYQQCQHVFIADDDDDDYPSGEESYSSEDSSFEDSEKESSDYGYCFYEGDTDNTAKTSSSLEAKEIANPIEYVHKKAANESIIDVDDIAKEFYDYLNSQFTSSRESKYDRNNNSTLTNDDDEFW